MDYLKLIPNLIRRGEHHSDLPMLRDALELCMHFEVDDAVNVDGKIIFDKSQFDQAHEWSKSIRTIAGKLVREKGVEEALSLYKDSLLFDAPHDLDCALIYAEWNRDYPKKFYEPRRKQLLPVVKAMQRLDNREIKILGVMMPPGVGKTTLEIMFAIWSAFRHPELATLMGSHSTSLLRGVYDEIMRMLEPDGEYLWHEIFPSVGFAGTNAKELQIDLGKRKRF